MLCHRYKINRYDKIFEKRQNDCSQINKVGEDYSNTKTCIKYISGNAVRTNQKSSVLRTCSTSFQGARSFRANNGHHFIKFSKVNR